MNALKAYPIEHREQLDRLAAALIKKEVLQKEDIQKILGDKKGSERNPDLQL